MRAVLKEIIPNHRILTEGIVSDDDSGLKSDVGEERVGLRFEITQVVVGERVPGDTVVIEGRGYMIDIPTMKRTALIDSNGHSAEDWQIGGEYVFFIAENDPLLRFRSHELVARVTASGGVVPILENSAWPEFAQVRSVDDVERIVADATQRATES